jgi:hypothetical protein
MTMPFARNGFPGGTLNYAEPGVAGNRQILTRRELVTRVDQVALALQRFGVQCGERVAGYLPNRFETLIAFLAESQLRFILLKPGVPYKNGEGCAAPRKRMSSSDRVPSCSSRNAN